MEYSSEYFEENSEDISRAHYNSSKYDKNKPFLDIKKVVIKLKPEGVKALANCLRGLNLNVYNNSYLTSQDVEIELLKTNENYEGICQIEFSLAEHAREIYSCHLGNSILTIQGDKGSGFFFK